MIDSLHSSLTILHRVETLNVGITMLHPVSLSHGGLDPTKTLCELAYGKPFSACRKDMQNNKLSIINFKVHCMIVSHLTLFWYASLTISSLNAKWVSYGRSLIEQEDTPLDTRIGNGMQLAFSLIEGVEIVKLCKKMIIDDMNTPVQDRTDQDELLTTLELLRRRYPRLQSYLARHQEEPRRKDG
jgi:hypothetical protein